MLGIELFHIPIFSFGDKYFHSGLLKVSSFFSSSFSCSSRHNIGISNYNVFWSRNIEDIFWQRINWICEPSDWWINFGFVYTKKCQWKSLCRINEIVLIQYIMKNKMIKWKRSIIQYERPTKAAGFFFSFALSVYIWMERIKQWLSWKIDRIDWIQLILASINLTNNISMNWIFQWILLWTTFS